MPKRTHSQLQEDSDGSLRQRERSNARNRQRRHRARLTEEQLQQVRERDRLYKQRSRARRLAQTDVTTASSSQPSASPSIVCHPNSKALIEEHDGCDDESDQTVTDDDLASDEDEACSYLSATPVSLHGDEQEYGSGSHKEGPLDSDLNSYGDQEQNDQSDPSHKSVNENDVLDGFIHERDVFGEWMDQHNEDRPYETLALHHQDELDTDEEYNHDASDIAQAYALPTPRHSDVYNDLVTGILGVQISANAETVTWTSGQRTVLPYLENPRGSRRKNVLQTDRDYVADLAQAPEALPSSDLVVFLSKDMPEDDLLQAIQDALSRNHTVVVRGCVNTNGFELTQEQLFKRYSIFVDRPIEPQDMRRRAKCISKPHSKTTLRDFLSDIDNPDVMQMLLDFSFPQLTLPPPFERLDDGMAIGWAQTQSAVNYESMQLPADLWAERTWGIAHHAGILSYPHHDAEGAATYCIPMAGVKSWVVVTPTVARNKMKATLQGIVCSGTLLSKHTSKAVFETINLYPGDLLIMPPGHLHAVYTPIAGMCRGGHFFNLDTMHLTELSRFLDTTHGKSFTNQAHRGTLETLCRLVLALPFISSPRKLYKNSLIALCGMVMYHAKYTAQEQPDQHSVTLEPAQAIADKVLQCFGITGLKHYQAHLKTTGEGVYERGEEVNVFDLLQGFRR